MHTILSFHRIRAYFIELYLDIREVCNVMDYKEFLQVCDCIDNPTYFHNQPNFLPRLFNYTIQEDSRSPMVVYENLASYVRNYNQTNCVFHLEWDKRMFYSSKEGNDGEIIYSQAHSNFIKIVSHLKFVSKSCILLL